MAAVEKESRSAGDEPEVAVVIPAFNAAATLQQQLDALENQFDAPPFTIVVVDDCSTDGTTELLESLAHRGNLVVRRTARQSGASAARNLGARSAGAGVLLFCDADDVVDPSWVATMAAAVDHHGFVTGSVDYGLLNADHLVETRGAAFQRALLTVDGTFPIAPGCNVGITRALFEEVGGFAVGLSVVEDQEISLRLWQRGHELHFEPRAVVNYRLRERPSERFRQAVSYGRSAMWIRREIDRLGLRRQPSGLTRRVVWLIRRVPSLGQPDVRERWLFTIGRIMGELHGMIRYRHVRR